MTPAKIQSFLLIDGAQLATAEVRVPMPDEHPAWLTHIYDDQAATVSPLLINIEAAHDAGGLDAMTGLVNALEPKLHASFIDTALSHADLLQHLRRFIMIRTVNGKAYTLRFADSTVLPILATVLDPTQWAALVGPIARWHVHGYDGALHALPVTDNIAVPAQTPLVLSDKQCAALAEHTAPSMMLAHLRDMVHGDALPGNAAEQHRWASEARRLWRSSHTTDEIVLRWLTSAALATAGAVLQHRGLPTLLNGADSSAIRTELAAAVSERRARVSGMATERVPAAQHLAPSKSSDAICNEGLK